ncbi:MAG: hypothetical protein ABW133_06895 [Polyangiaceae bacterium]
MARLIRLVLTFFVLVGGALSALGCDGVDVPRERVERAQLTLDAAALNPPESKEKGASVRRSSKRTDPKTSARLPAPHVGDSATPRFSGTLRVVAKGRGTFLSLLSHALADSELGQPDEFEPADAPDFVDDDCPQAFAVTPHLSELSRRAAVKPLVAPNLWGIQPSVGHPHGDDEPPRV